MVENDKKLEKIRKRFKKGKFVTFSSNRVFSGRVKARPFKFGRKIIIPVNVGIEDKEIINDKEED